MFKEQKKQHHRQPARPLPQTERMGNRHTTVTAPARELVKELDAEDAKEAQETQSMPHAEAIRKRRIRRNATGLAIVVAAGVGLALDTVSSHPVNGGSGSNPMEVVQPSNGLMLGDLPIEANPNSVPEDNAVHTADQVMLEAGLTGDK